MPTEKYFRDQTELCLRLARETTDAKLARTLHAMAADYQRKADELAPDAPKSQAGE